MKKTFLSIVAMTALCFVSCSKEDSGIPAGTDPAPINQVKTIDKPEMNDAIALAWDEDGWPCNPAGDMKLTEDELKEWLIGHKISDNNAYILDEDCYATFNCRYWNYIEGKSTQIYTFLNDTSVAIEGDVVAPNQPYDGPYTHLRSYSFSTDDNILSIGGMKAIKILNIEKDPKTETVTLKAVIDMNYAVFNPSCFCYLVSEIKPTITGSSN